MCQPGAEQVAFMVDENLGLVLQATESRRVYDAIAITLVLTAIGGGRLGMLASQGAGGIGSVEGKRAVLSVSCVCVHGFRPQTAVSR